MSFTVNVVLPEGTLSVLRIGPPELGEEMKRAAVCKWYEMGMVSQSKGAEILDLSRSEFLDLLWRYRVSPFQVDDEDLAAGSVVAEVWVVNASPLVAKVLRVAGKGPE